MTEHTMHSTGRGGAGNIGHDDREYTDGSITREGIYGASSEPEYSSGRGGAGNIVGNSPRSGTPFNSSEHSTSSTTAPTRPSNLGNSTMRSEDIIPETAMRDPGHGYDNFHTGRGGGGNVYKEKYGGHSGPQDGEGGGFGKIIDKVEGLFGKK